MDPVSPDCRHQGQSLIRNDFPLSAQICLVIVPLNCPLRSSRGLTSSLLIALFKQIDSLLRRIVMFQSNKVRTHLAQVWNVGLVDWPQGAITTSQHNKSAEIKETNSRGNHADPRVSKSDGCWWSRRPPADGLLSYATRMLEQHLVTKTSPGRRAAIRPVSPLCGSIAAPFLPPAGTEIPDQFRTLHL